MLHRSVLMLCLALGLCRSAYAQPSPSPSSWFAPQTINVSSRYRFVESSTHEVTANQILFKDAFRAKFNLDGDRRFPINVGAFSGSSFTSSWDATGIGSGSASANMYVKQLYGSATPVRGLELQIGGLYINHGENTEITSYDDDGYVMGERVTLRRRALAYFDEVSLTRAALSPTATPGVINTKKKILLLRVFEPSWLHPL